MQIAKLYTINYNHKGVLYQNSKIKNEYLVMF